MRLANHPGGSAFWRWLAMLMVAACHTAAATSSAATATAHRLGASNPTAAVVTQPQAEQPTLDSSVSATVAKLARWVVATRDNAAMPYVIIDKVHAEVFVFDATGHMQAAAPALLGLAKGDRSVAGVGDEKMSAIRPQDRITPAGRFVASLGRDPHGKEILWVDYKDAIALHPVVKGTPQERRAERLASPTSADNRISYGCINVPLTFYRKFISAAFAHTSGLVYILPETSSAPPFVGSYGIGAGSPSAAGQ
jgi:hypothetical protein